MQVNVSSRNTQMSPSDRDLVVKKVSRLGGKFLDMESADVHFFEEKNPRLADHKDVCEVTLAGHGHHVRVKANGPNQLAATDFAIEKLENQLRKLKTKLSAQKRFRDVRKQKQADTSADLSAALLDDETPAAADHSVEEIAEYVESFQIVKSKVVENLTLSPLDAAMRMDLVGHGFYFFTNSETGSAAVVYRRDDGHVGLIDVAENES
ncbi:MAG: ribosome-associated translation inhibitor RaiA [Microthrixaceae bacterium]|nr:ribosome-associated translation inhibitor RaiA [Microthrixaceae bacterium]MCO5314471.1 ribosome-associated translation inhibitor RaiA [Microthrixaceae bacterium]